jgi:hypothetical protein
MTSSITVVRAENLSGTPLGGAMNEIRTRLDQERIQPANFKIVVGRTGLGFEISFDCEAQAQRFRRQFSSLVGWRP